MAETPENAVAILEALLSSENGELLDANAYGVLARLRRFNRDAHVRVNEQRQTTMDARNAMDQTHLGLQNLLYERRHLEREITKAQQFQLGVGPCVLPPLLRCGLLAGWLVHFLMTPRTGLYIKTSRFMTWMNSAVLRRQKLLR